MVLVSAKATKDWSGATATPLAYQKSSASTCVLPVWGVYDNSRPDMDPCTSKADQGTFKRYETRRVDVLFGSYRHFKRACNQCRHPQKRREGCHLAFVQRIVRHTTALLCIPVRQEGVEKTSGM